MSLILRDAGLDRPMDLHGGCSMSGKVKLVF